MKFFTNIIWGFIWGEVIGYIGSQLLSLTYNFWAVGIVGMLIATLVPFVVDLFTESTLKAENKNNK